MSDVFVANRENSKTIGDVDIKFIDAFGNTMSCDKLDFTDLVEGE